MLSATDHLSACESCRRQVERAMGGDTAFFALKSAVFSDPAERFHLSPEQAADFVDGILAGEELRMVDDHLTSCELCRMTISDLRAFRDQIAPGRDHEYRPSSLMSELKGLWERLAKSIRAFLPGPPALVPGLAVAALLLAAAGWLVWQSLRQEERKPEIVRTETSPAASTPAVVPSTPPDAPAEMLIARLDDGGREVTLDREGNLTGIDDLSPAHRQLVRDALVDQRIEKSRMLAGLSRTGNQTVRGDAEEGSAFSVIEPTGKVSLADRPTFRWSALEGATGYLVEIYNENFVLTATSSLLEGQSWTPSEPLPRGVIYSWQVKAIREGEQIITPRAPAPQAKFRILDQTSADEITRARRSSRSSHLTLALLYARAGLLDEAEQELRALRKANPDSTIVRRLLASLRALK